MTGPAGVSFARHNAESARAKSALVQDIFEDAYVELIASSHPFVTTDAFMDRFRSYCSNPQLDLVIAYENEEPVGQAWGWPSQTSASWRGTTTELGSDFTYEDGTRTFTLSELMVKQEHAGRGIARALHDELLRARPEKRAVLLVLPGNARAYQRYSRWGWEKVAQKRPGLPDAPTFDVLVKSLEHTS